MELSLSVVGNGAATTKSSNKCYVLNSAPRILPSVFCRCAKLSQKVAAVASFPESMKTRRISVERGNFKTFQSRERALSTIRTPAVCGPILLQFSEKSLHRLSKVSHCLICAALESSDPGASNGGSNVEI